jgi:hypothetical protein
MSGQGASVRDVAGSRHPCCGDVYDSVAATFTIKE